MNVSKHVIEWLWKYGHFRNPNPSMADARNVRKRDLPRLTLEDRVVKTAIRSIQELDANLDPLAHFVHGRAAIADGDFGEATLSLLSLPRCGRPDYGTTGEATGRGSWPVPGCDPEQSSDIHSVRVNLDTSRCPSKVKSYLDECIRNVERVAAEVGISVRHVLDGNPRDAEHDVRWEPIPGGVIGYAYFPTPGTCNQTVTARLDTGYQPDAHMFATLMIHEYNGHSFNLQHTRGGIMNPSILRVDPLTWRGDPSFNTLKRFFGGEPIEPTEPDEPDPTGGVRVKGPLTIYQDGKVIGKVNVDQTDDSKPLPPFPV